MSPILRLPKKVALLTDTSYSRQNGGGAMCVAQKGRGRGRRYVRLGTNQLRAEALALLRANGVEVQAVVSHGRRGLLQQCAPLPSSMHQFH